MRCDDARLALSSRLDGETAPVAEAALSVHLNGCALCRAWLAGAERVTRLARVQPVAVPDLTERILRAVTEEGLLRPAHPDRAQLWRTGLRWALGLLAILQLIAAVPDLIGAPGHDAHAGREVAAFDIALAVGLLLVAWYPEYARVFAPVVVTLVFCFASISALDTLQGLVTPGRIAIHGAALVQALLIWRLAKIDSTSPKVSAHRTPTAATPWKL